MDAARPTPEEWFEIQQVIFSYAGGIDSKDYELFRSGLTVDVNASYAPPIGPFEGIDELATWMEIAHAKLDSSLHRITNVTLVEFSAGEALVKSYVDALLVRHRHPGGGHFDVAGIYTDRLLLGTSGWKVTRKGFEYLHGTGNLAVLDQEAADSAVEGLFNG